MRAGVTKASLLGHTVRSRHSCASHAADLMRILHLVNHCDWGHGNATVAVDLACAQAAAGDSVWYGGAGGSLIEVLRGAGVRHKTIVQRSTNVLAVVAAIRKIRRLIVGERVDIVHAHMMAGAVLGFLASRFTRAKLVTTVHNSFDAHSVLMRLGDRVVAVSNAERASLLARRFDPGRTGFVLNGPLQSARVGFGKPIDGLVVARPSVATVCGLHHRKGVEDLLAAFATIAPRHPDAHLHFVGDGPDRGLLEAQVKSAGLDARVHFFGNIERPDQVLAQTDVFVLASYAEPGGLVVFEARAAGCAMIVSAVGGSVEGMDGGEAGILFPAGDRAALAAAMDRLLGDPQERARLSQNARRGIERFTASRVAADYRIQYEIALKQRPPDDSARGPPAPPTGL